jgi:basic amino acid/polyamine antiporter, APA family
MGHGIISSVPVQIPQSSPRKVGVLGVFAIASGAMISSGIFVLPGVAFERSGPAMILAYGLA